MVICLGRGGFFRVSCRKRWIWFNFSIEKYSTLTIQPLRWFKFPIRLAYTIIPVPTIISYTYLNIIVGLNLVRSVQ